MAAISAVRIAKMALGHILSDVSIESFTENSKAARQSALWYDPSRLQALEAYDWSFARKRVALALHDEDPPDEWGYRYVYPADCVAARVIENPAGHTSPAIPFFVEMSADGSEKTILTNAEDAILIYTFDQETTAMFSWHFVTVVSYFLAGYLAPSMTGKAEIRDAMFKAAQVAILRAAAHNSNEQVERAPREAEWISGR